MDFGHIQQRFTKKLIKLVHNRAKDCHGKCQVTHGRFLHPEEQRYLLNPQMEKHILDDPPKK